jgi:hypothetical protein
LHDSGTTTYGELFSSFARFCSQSPDNFFSRFCERSIANAEYYDIVNYPQLYHAVLHGHRNEFDALLYEFVSTQDWWSDRNARVLLEMDLLRKPFLYSDTPVEHPNCPVRCLDILGAADRAYTVSVPEEYAELVGLVVNGSGSDEVNVHRPLRVNHKRGQFPFNPDQTPEHNADYCNGMIMRIESILPTYEQLRA